MPTKIQVKISNVSPAVRGAFNGFDIKGYNATDGKAHKDFCFETTQKGDLTKVAAVVKDLVDGDWVELTKDDSQYKNITFAQRIGEPAGSTAPAAGSGGGGAPSGGGSPAGGGAKPDKMSKAEWAAKQAAERLNANRQVALTVAVTACAADSGKVTKPKVEQIEKMSLRFTSFLETGDFEGKLVEPVVVETPPVVNEAPPEESSTGGNPVSADDEIPF